MLAQSARGLATLLFGGADECRKAAGSFMHLIDTA